MRTSLALAVSTALFLSTPIHAQSTAGGQAIQRPNAVPQSPRIDIPKTTANTEMLVTACRNEREIAAHFRNAERAISLAKNPQTSEERKIQFLRTARSHLRAIEVASACPEGLSSSVRKNVDDTKNAVIGKIG